MNKAYYELLHYTIIMTNSLQESVEKALAIVSIANIIIIESDYIAYFIKK
jgi:hypothetical protein